MLHNAAWLKDDMNHEDAYKKRYHNETLRPLQFTFEKLDNNNDSVALFALKYENLPKAAEICAIYRKVYSPKFLSTVYTPRHMVCSRKIANDIDIPGCGWSWKAAKQLRCDWKMLLTKLLSEERRALEPTPHCVSTSNSFVSRSHVV